jgi:hypothetical protein
MRYARSGVRQASSRLNGGISVYLDYDVFG